MCRIGWGGEGETGGTELDRRDRGRELLPEGGCSATDKAFSEGNGRDEAGEEDDGGFVATTEVLALSEACDIRTGQKG